MVPEVCQLYKISEVIRLILRFSNLNRRRYAQNDETLYVAPADERTDYVSITISLIHSCTDSMQSQPPMANFYSGVLK